MRALALLLLALVACTPLPEAPPPGAGGGPTGACPAADYQALVGANVAAVTLPAGLDVRLTGPERIVTADFRPERMNLWVARDGTIERVYCG